MPRILIAFLLLLAACAPAMTGEQQVFLRELADRPVTCSSAQDCDDKWNRAVQWVSEHSDKKIRTVSDTLIATNMVYAGGQRPVLQSPEFTVVKYAQGKHRYVMDFDSYCNHGFDCNPSGLTLKASFVTFVMGPPPGVQCASDACTRKISR